LHAVAQAAGGGTWLAHRLGNVLLLPQAAAATMKPRRRTCLMGKPYSKRCAGGQNLHRPADPAH